MTRLLFTFFVLSVWILFGQSPGSVTEEKKVVAKAPADGSVLTCTFNPLPGGVKWDCRNFDGSITVAGDYTAATYETMSHFRIGVNVITWLLKKTAASPVIEWQIDANGTVKTGSL